MEDSIVCDIYGRKSTLDKAVSVSGQLKDCVDAIERRARPGEPWRVGETYADPEISASRFTKKLRPEFNELVKSYQAYKPKPGERRALAIWECSRGSREIGEWVSLMVMCREKRILILAADEDRVYDPTNRREFRKLIEEGLDAADESERTSERCLRGQRTAAKAGRPQGRLVYGYVREYDGTGKFERQVKHPEQAAIVEEIFRRIADDDSLHGIVDNLNARKVAPPMAASVKRPSKCWYPSAVRRIAMRESYLGQRVHLGAVVAEDCWPALVDADTFAKCVRILSEPERQTANLHVLRYPLSGIARCGACDEVIHTHWVRRPPAPDPVRMYMCMRRGCGKIGIRADYLDDYVTEVTHARLLSPDAAHLFTPPKRSAEIDAAAADEARLTAMLDGYYADAARLGEGGLSQTGLIRMEQLLLPQIADAKHRQQGAPRTATLLTGLDPLKIVRTWHGMTVVRQRAIINDACDLVVGKGTPGRRGFDRSRLSGCKYRGDERTWGELWAAGDDRTNRRVESR